MLVLNRPRLRRLSSFLGAPVAPSPLEEVFIDVDYAYMNANLAMDSGQNANYVPAKSEIDTASMWLERANKHLRMAEEKNLITPEERVKILQTVVLPLSDVIRNVRYGITAASKNWLVEYWNAFKKSLMEVIAGTTGFWGERWEKLIKTYALISGYAKRIDHFVSLYSNIIKDFKGDDVQKAFLKFKTSVQRVKALKLQVDSMLKMNSIPIKAVEEEIEKRKKEADFLGAGPVASAVVITIGGFTITAATISAITSFIVVTILTELIGFLIEVFVCLGDLGRVTYSPIPGVVVVRIEKRVSGFSAIQGAYDEAVKEVSQATGALKEATYKRFLEAGVNLSTATAEKLVELSPELGVSKDDLFKKFEQAAAGGTALERALKSGIVPYFLVGVALFAAGLYIRSRAKEA